MNLGEDKIYSLIGKHLLGNLTKDESSELDDWFSEKKKHKIEFEDIVELWLKTGQFKFSEKINTPLALTTVHEKADIKPKNVFRLKIVSQIAAILVLSVLFSGLFSYLFFGNKKAVDKLVYEEVNVAYGTKINIELSDGTTVYLNSGSSLRFSNLFAQNHERKVELKGEGFFKVAKGVFIFSENLNCPVFSHNSTISSNSILCFFFSENQSSNSEDSSFVKLPSRCLPISEYILSSLIISFLYLLLDVMD